ncbi:MAG: hypothetical protein KAR19_03160 [Bacteroidales bacterium]|nr:hypothetical protein [Bacteroidales bacterium]
MRRTEVVTGLVIILAAFSFVTSLLLDFNFVSPYSTLQEDLAYLSEHINNQKISSYSWLATSVFILIAIPFYLIIFHKRLKALHYLNGLFMLGAFAGFLVMGKQGLDLHQTMVQILGEGFDQANEHIKLSLLEQFRQEQIYRRLGSSCVGLFAIGLSLTKFSLERFPLFSSVLLLVSGPVLIFFNWYDSEHLARTGAMAGIMIGVVVFCVRLINKGLTA